MKTLRLSILLLIALWTAGCGSSEGAITTNLGSAPIATGQASRAGAVYLDGPRTADLQALDASGTVLYTTRSTQTGSFYLPDSSSIVKLVATLGDGTRLEKRIAPGEGYLWVDLVSHLTSLYAAAYPELSLDQASSAVRSGLSIPAGTGTNGLSSLSGSPFAAALFVAQANQNGGFSAYCQQVVGQIGSGQTLTFRVQPPNLLSDFLRKLQAPRVARVELLGVLDAFQFIGKTGLDDVVSFGVDSLLSAGFAAVGLNIGTSNKLKELQQTVNEIEQQILQLEQQVSTDFEQSTLSQNFQTVKSYRIGLQTQSDQLASTAGQAAANNSTGANATTYNHGAAAVPSSVQTAITSVLKFAAETTTHQLLSYITSSSPSLNLSLGLNQYFASQSGVPSYEQHFYYSVRQDDWTVGQPLPSPGPGPQPPPSLQSGLDYVRSTVVEACNLWCENAQANLLAGSTADGYQAPANALNLARQGGGSDGVLAAEMALLAAQNQVPYPVGNNHVLIDLTQNRMWYLEYEDGTSTGPQLATAQGNAEKFSLGFAGGTWTPAPAPTVYQKDANGKGQKGPDGGWRLPTYQECHDLRNLAQASDQFGLRKLGFDVPDSSNVKVHLYGNPKPDSFIPGGSDYMDYNWQKDNTDTVDYTGGGPLYSYMYVRNLPDVSGGDTAEIIQTGYGFLPDQYSFQQNGQGTPVNSTIAGQQNAELQFVGQSNGYQQGFAYLTDSSQWSTSDPSVMDLSPTGQGTVITHWHGPGSVTVTVVRRGATSQLPSGGASNNTLSTISASFTLTSPYNGPDPYTSFEVAPFNAGTLSTPTQQSYYLLGYRSGGTVDDLTSKATFQVLDSSGNPSTVAAFNNPNSNGSLVFSPRVAGHQTLTIKATFQGQVVAQGSYVY